MTGSPFSPSRRITIATVALAGPALAAMLLLPTATPVAAQDGLAPPLLTCTTLNCQSLLVAGRVNGFGTTSNPWVMTFAAQTGAPVDGRCLRFHIVQQNRNFEMTVVAPDGRVFTNDNGGIAGCTTCPRVVVDVVGASGYFTVVVNSANGSATEGSFVLRAGQYNPGNNINCRTPTPPQFDAATARKAVKVEAAARRAAQ